MPASDNAASEGIDKFVTAVFILLGVFVWVVLAVALGMKAGRFAHWTGEALLVAGVLLAAKGISDVRHQWVPQKLGIRGNIEARLHRVREVCAKRYWLYKKRFMDRHPKLARLLRLRIRQSKRWLFEHAVAADTAGSVATAPPLRVRITDGTPEDRIAELERRLADLEDEHDAFRAQRDQDFKTTWADIERETAERTAGDARLRKHVDESLADAVGGGLQLQTWGVICLLVGTILTSFW